MAINYPSNPTNGQIHTAAGIQWKWDSTGGTWLCQGTTGTYTLGIATATSLGGIKIGSNLQIDSSTGVLDAVMNLNNESIEELTNVTFNNVTLDASNGGGKVLAWDQSLQAFAPVDQSGSGGGSSTLGGLTDVTITTPSAGQVLKYNGSAWINDTDATGAGGAENDTLDSVTSRGSVTTNNIEAARIHANGILATGPTAGSAATGVYVSVAADLPSGAATDEYRDLLLQSTKGGGTLTYATLSNYNSKIEFSSSYSLVAGGLTYPNSNGNSGEVLTSDGTGNVTWQAASGGGSGLQARATGTGNTGSITDGAAVNVNISDMAKTYALLKVETSHAAWVTVYTDPVSRSDDSGRNEFTDPSPGTGVIAEVVTTAAATSQIITPGTIGWNNDATPVDVAYLKVVNKSGSTQSDITVTLTFVALEA